jgi:hypothetical protein
MTYYRRDTEDRALRNLDRAQKNGQRGNRPSLATRAARELAAWAQAGRDDDTAALTPLREKLQAIERHAHRDQVSKDIEAYTKECLEIWLQDLREKQQATEEQVSFFRDPLAWLQKEGLA